MENRLPLVSIITPCYNYGRYLGETLESLISQTYHNWECIIVNDGSTDSTEEVALSYTKKDSRFIYISQNNTGLPGARNAALKKAKGDYIQLLDADDFLENEKLALQVELFEKNETVDFIYGKMLIFSNKAINREFTPFQLINHHEITGVNEKIITALITDTFFLPGCVIFRKALYELVGGFNESLYGLEDWEYWSRAALLGFYFYYDNRLGTHLLVRDHDSNMSKVKDKMLLSRVVARTSIITFINELIQNNNFKLSLTFLKKLLKKHKITLSKEIYEYNIHYGDKTLAIKELLRYSLRSGKPLYPLTRIIQSIRFRIKYSHGN